MGSLSEKILETFPDLEVKIRCILHKFPGLKKNALKLFHKLDEKKDSNIDKDLTWEEIKKSIIDFGIEKGDLVLVHSGTKRLMEIGIQPKAILEFLKELVGDEGTLCFAAYAWPECKYSEADKAYIYDVMKTPAWTGLLPNLFLRYKDVVRSENPVNSIAARGRDALEIVKNDIDCIFPLGKGSSWEYLSEHNSKILFLGVGAGETCSMLNRQEDVLGPDWPVADWFKEVPFVIIRKNGEKKRILVKVRDDEKNWYRFYRMNYMEKWMRINGFLNTKDIRGVYIGVINNLRKMNDILIREAKNGRLLYKIPQRYQNKNVLDKKIGCI